MIGGIVLKYCLESPQITKVFTITRWPSGMRHEKLEEIIYQDFLDYSAIRFCFQDIDIAYFCLGAYAGSVPDSQFREITVDFPRAFADMLNSESPDAAFCFLSGAGADLKEKSRMAFARYKGVAENHLLNADFKGLYIFRPSYIYPVEKRKEPNFMYRIQRFLYPLIRLFGDKASITSFQLGEAMFQIGLRGNNKTILENREIIKRLEHWQ